MIIDPNSPSWRERMESSIQQAILSNGGVLPNSSNPSWNVRMEELLKVFILLSVSSAAIPAGSITNVEVAATAAIAWGKISKAGASPSDVGAASIAQGLFASTALQPGAAISNISGLQTALSTKQDSAALGSAAFVASSTFATSSQGTLANTALQPATIGISVQAFNGQLATIAALAPTSGQFLRRGASAWQSAALGAGDIPVLDVAQITTGIFANARINWESPGAIGSVTPNSIVATSLVTTGTITAGDRIAAPEVTSAVYRNNVGAGTNIAATSTEFRTGRGTGTGALGDLVFTTADFGASGATIQAVTTKMVVKGRGSVLIGTTTDNGIDRLQVAGSTTIAGNLTATGTSHTIGANANTSTFLGLNGAAGGNRQMAWQTAGLNRWNLYADTGTEAGSNTGSLMTLSYYNDAGGYAGDIFKATRAGVFTVSAPTTRFTGANLGFFNATATTKPTVTGSKGGNAALASLITALATLGLVTDTTT